MESLAKKILKADSLILSTHRESDGDGLGAQLGLYYALKKIGKNVRLLNVDPMAKRYEFLDADRVYQYFETEHDPVEKTDLALIFDTNDARFLQPLYGEFEKKCKQILFVDHHPVLKHGPQPPQGSFIDVNAASTGEIAFHLIQHLKIELDPKIARALYASIVFDTQLFRFVRQSPESHLIAAELLRHEKEPDEIHRRIFGNQTIQKMAFLSKALGQIEYFGRGRLALLKIQDRDLLFHGLDTDESRDVIDMIMNIESLEVAVLFREDAVDSYKVSLRSKGRVEVLTVAESLGGGGHQFAAGAFLRGTYDQIKAKTVDSLLAKLKG